MRIERLKNILIENTDELIFEFKALTCSADPKTLCEYKERIINGVNVFEKKFPDAANTDVVHIYSAPGRTEIGGNHTDHQHGEVLAASVNLDIIAVAAPIQSGSSIKIFSEGFGAVNVDLSKDPHSYNEGTSEALISGIVDGFRKRGYKAEPFCAYVQSSIPAGSGLSSSAAFEDLIGTILSSLFNDSEVKPIEIAVIGRYAENMFFGKPCGLMDQTACAVGGLVHIDFGQASAEAKNQDLKPDNILFEPLTERLNADFENFGYSLCITDTGSSHADLTSDYASIPQDMRSVAKTMGKTYLGDLTREEFEANLISLGSKLTPDEISRAVHFYSENDRVKAQVSCLLSSDFEGFLAAVKASGESSRDNLRNIVSKSHPTEDSLSRALIISEKFLSPQSIFQTSSESASASASEQTAKGVCRVHGGGFAGTIQAFVINSEAPRYKKLMDSAFGRGACRILSIRQIGSTEILGCQKQR